ncbi:MAG: hypothetical protein JXR36_14865 [Bacteroidales bacterium]|nr:hypothetical protein [Bacteroidales bacterium]
MDNFEKLEIGKKEIGQFRETRNWKKGDRTISRNSKLEKRRRAVSQVILGSSNLFVSQ